MRQFVIVGHEAPTDADFALNDLPGGAGRLDLLARSLLSAFLVSHGIREEVQVRLVLADTYILRLVGRELRGLHPDERSTAANLRAALETAAGVIGAGELEHSAGIYVKKGDFGQAISEASEEGTVVQLHEDGDPVESVEPPADPVFVLSDHQDFTAGEQALLDELADHRLRLGPVAMHADDAIAVAHNWLDTADS